MFHYRSILFTSSVIGKKKEEYTGACINIDQMLDICHHASRVKIVLSFNNLFNSDAIALHSKTIQSKIKFICSP